MTIRIDPISAEGFAIQLDEYQKILLHGNRLTVTVLEHVTGKLGWFCEVVQSGRLHIHYIWRYLSSAHSIKNEVKQGVISEFDWWLKTLRSWAKNTDCRGQYPILNGAELLNNPQSIEICQSDASGTDGFGYVCSTLDSVDFDWYSTRWSQDRLPKSSHVAEIRAFHSFIMENSHKAVNLIIWITDSESACYSVNRANCDDQNAYPLLVDIYERCDELTLQVVALWVPREFNNLTDHLSHLASLLCRDSVSGRESFL
jgi:hypothetical protein